VILHNLTSDEVKRVATYLNGRNLGKTTTASKTGINVTPGLSSSNYYWENQEAGKQDGIYPADDLLNGIPGPATYTVEEHYRDLTAPPVVVMHTVSFLPYPGATPLPSVEVVSGTIIDKPTDPTEDGFNFEYWSADGNTEFNFATPITTDTQLVGLWSAIPIVVPPVTPTDPTTPLDPSPPVTTTPTDPTTPTKPVKDNWFVSFWKLIASVWFNMEKK
jgi:hypothetical protein